MTMASETLVRSVVVDDHGLRDVGRWSSSMTMASEALVDDHSLRDVGR
jgi:hypothetical protein